MAHTGGLTNITKLDFSHRNVAQIMQTIRQADTVPTFLAEQMHRVLTLGCPTYFNAEQ